MRKLFVLAALVATFVLPAASSAVNLDPGGAVCHWVCGYTMDGYQCWLVWW